MPKLESHEWEQEEFAIRTKALTAAMRLCIPRQRDAGGMRHMKVCHERTEIRYWLENPIGRKWAGPLLGPLDRLEQLLMNFGRPSDVERWNREAPSIANELERLIPAPPPASPKEPPPDGTVILTVTEAADYLGYSDKQVREWIKDSLIAADNIVGTTRYRFMLHELNVKKEAKARAEARKKANKD